MILDDNSLMPFGKYEGCKMQDVPATYLKWLYDNNKASKPVRRYIKENLETIKLEIKQGL